LSSRTLINLILLVISVILAAVIWMTPDNTGTSQPARLTEIEPTEISRILLSNKSSPGIVMERTPAGWSMTEPYAIEANTPRIEILLDILSTPSLEQFPLPAERLDEFGLNEPAAVITLNNTSLEFGSVHPLNYRRYIRIADTLHLTKDLFPHHAMAPAEAYVSHRPIPTDATIGGIKTDNWELTRIDGNWRLSPASKNLSADAINAKIDAWENIHAAGVEKASGLQTSDHVLVSLTGQQEPVFFEIATHNGKLYLVRPDLGIAYRLPPGSNLTAPPAAAEADPR
jgi:hypothetical protein